MIKDMRDKWIIALESNDYEQGQKWLRTDNKFCCLGVLCNIIDPNKWDFDRGFFNYSGWETAIPDNLLEQLEISLVQQNELIELNDKKGSNFKEIAQWIKENL
jgi:hypothetical protein